ncbi:MAG: hypothetical protein P4M08_08190 [Oligoflexia bacterium]|nr:hypothetical protein [Oligoflexia bacterium]
MDFPADNTFIRLSRRIPFRIPALRPNFIPPKRLYRPFIVAGALILAAVTGLTAQHFSANAAREEWEIDHPPTPRAWEHGLGAQGFRPVLKPEEIHLAGRKLPLRSDPSGSVWTTADLKWIVIFQEDAKTGNAFRLYCWSSCRSLPETWVPAGKGWMIFESLLARLEAHPPQTPVARLERKIHRNRGEILY